MPPLRYILQPFPPVMRGLQQPPQSSLATNKCFLQRVKRQQMVVHASSPQWGLPLVLDMVSDPHEPLKHSFLWLLSVKMAMLLALTSVKKVKYR